MSSGLYSNKTDLQLFIEDMVDGITVFKTFHT